MNYTIEIIIYLIVFQIPCIQVLLIQYIIDNLEQSFYTLKSWLKGSINTYASFNVKGYMPTSYRVQDVLNLAYLHSFHSEVVPFEVKI